MILDGTLKEGEYKFYEDLGNGWVEEIPPISAYGSVDLDELNKVVERLGKCPNYDELIKDNCKKDKEIERLNNIINELEYCIENSYAEWGYEIFYIMRKDGKDETLYSLEDVKNRIKELKEGK